MLVSVMPRDRARAVGAPAWSEAPSLLEGAAVGTAAVVDDEGVVVGEREAAGRQVVKERRPLER